MNKKLFALLPLIMFLAGCSIKPQESSEEKKDSSEISSSESIESSSSEEEPEVEYEEATINLLGTDITTSSDLSNNTPKTKFLNLFNGLLEDVDSTCIFFQKYGGDNSTSCLCIGTQGASGSMSLTFNVDVKTVTVHAQNFYNHWSYGSGEGYVEGFSVDTDAEFSINGENYDLSTEDGDHTPEIKEFTRDLKTPTPIIDFENSEEKHRAYILDITIKYIKE